MQLIVLSAGKGSRLPNKFRKKPKCLVEIMSKPLLLYNENFFKKFKKKFIITGYKYLHLRKIAKKIGFKTILNKKYKSTNMVYSLFLSNKMINQDVVITYGDVIFHEKIFNHLKVKKDLMPINNNWFKNWKNRMPLSKVLEDAENLFVKKNNLIEIGTKIDKKKIPNYQFMGILKLKKKTFFKCYDFFKKLKNNNIDMTSFINLCIKNKIMTLKTVQYKDYWYEIDTISDHKYASKDLKKW
mgnify:CR=1 FL=1|tara:strand:- start:3330 stop:4052 length:723 start_codon:yes stop_codon:yes gene_type:complete